MTESTRKKIVLGLLIVSVVWGVWNLWPSEKVETSDSQEMTNNSNNPTSLANVTGDNHQENINRIQQSKWGADPFRLGKKELNENAVSQNGSLSWILSGIICSDNSSMVVINKQPAKVGDIIDKAEVVAINKKTVTLRHNGKKFTLTINKS